MLFTLPILSENSYIYNVIYEEIAGPQAGQTVVVGLSGGVDSALTALLLQEKGCTVIGATMSSWNNDLPLTGSETGMRNSCYGPDEALDIAQCQDFCKKHGMQHLVVDVRAAFQTEVLEYFRREYRSGRTPNPCVRCNRMVKFGALLDGIAALGIDFDYFCTGHYARLLRPVVAAGTNGEVRPLYIGTAFDKSKDQSYFLSRISSQVLERVRFPLGSMSKKDVFEMARQRSLIAAERRESQDFVPPEYFELIFADKPSIPGNIVDLDGKILGRHRGIEHYTVGQRRGLGVSSAFPLYVHSIDREKNQVVLAHNEDLLAAALIADDWVWPGNSAPTESFEALVKIRLASPPVLAKIALLPAQTEEEKLNPCWKVTFAEPQRAVAPGQSVAAFQDGVIIGGGIISRGIQYEKTDLP